MNHTIESLHWRYAVKSFDENYTLPQAKIDILKQAFNLTPTSFGLQPLKMIVIKNKELRKKLLPYSMGQDKVVTASHLLVICIEKDFTTDDVADYFDRLKAIRNTPDDILEPFKKYLLNHFETLSKNEIKRGGIQQAYIALGNLMTVCAVEKIDACPMEGFVPKEYDKILELDAHGLTSVLLLPVGKRADDDYMAKLAKVRKPLEESVIDFD